MKRYEITYLDTKGTKTVVADSLQEKYKVINKCEDSGYAIERVREFDPVDVEERLYA